MREMLREQLKKKSKNQVPVNREVKHDVNGRRQTAKITSDFEFFSFIESVNKAHKIGITSLTIRCKYK